MNLPSLLFATVLAASSAGAQESSPGTNIELEEYGRKETGGIAMKRGLSWGDDKKYTSTAAALLLDGYLAEFRLRREETPRERVPDSLKIAGVALEGTRRYRAYQSDFSFGMELAERGRKWYDLKLYGQVTGGFQVVKNNLSVDREQIPGDPEVGFYAGGGGRGEAGFRVPKIGSYNFSVSVGRAVEYLKDMDEFLREPIDGVNYGAYALLRLSREKIRKELRIKKE